MQSRAQMLGLVIALSVTGCAWNDGKKWVDEPQNAEQTRASSHIGGEGENRQLPSHDLGKRDPSANPDGNPVQSAPIAGTALGTFRNTYYDFPSEAEFQGPRTPLMSATCAPIAQVPRSFYDAVCVQGSGKLARGATVSFAKRDCSCALPCARTGQRICFEALDTTRFPYGRGASGQPIRPLVSVAADTHVLPMGSVIYVREFDGMVLPGDTAPHDGCFIVEDRGGAVKGEHIDIFTGTPDVTREVNRRIPSNVGVSVFRDVAKCQRLTQI